MFLTLSGSILFTLDTTIVSPRHLTINKVGDTKIQQARFETLLSAAYLRGPCAWATFAENKSSIQGCK